MSAQGDRGFDGLPGLPGEKGHRVSCQFQFVQVQFVKTVCQRKKVYKKIKQLFSLLLLQYRLGLNPCENCSLRSRDLEGLLMNK